MEVMACHHFLVPDFNACKFINYKLVIQNIVLQNEIDIFNFQYIVFIGRWMLSPLD